MGAGLQHNVGKEWGPSLWKQMSKCSPSKVFSTVSSYLCIGVRHNVTTNLAESWMHVRSKFDGGKVINRSQSGSWEHRCMGAGLQHNVGKEWGPSLWKQMSKCSPSKVFSTVSQRSAKLTADTMVEFHPMK